MLDDWRAGIDTYLFDRETAKEHLRRAQPILAEQFSVEAIGRQWNEALGTCLGVHVEPRIDWRQAAQSA
jgi:hypothetical protein